MVETDHVPLLVDIFAAASVPFVLVATKCDKRSIDGRFETSLGSYDIHRTSPDMPQKQKMCIAVILRDIFSQRDGKCGEPNCVE